MIMIIQYKEKIEELKNQNKELSNELKDIYEKVNGQ
jgi:uncharacterized protein (UPF0335 family)